MKTLQLASPKNMNVKTSFFKNVTELKLVSSVEVLSVADNLVDRVIATVRIPESQDIRKLLLWEGDAYTNIGDWTQEQAEDKIKELI